MLNYGEDTHANATLENLFEIDKISDIIPSLEAAD